jgi:hypothetical protein
LDLGIQPMLSSLVRTKERLDSVTRSAQVRAESCCLRHDRIGCRACPQAEDAVPSIRFGAP